MKTHPAADIFPPMNEAEYAGLKADIAEHGVREPVWTWRGLLLDGRHRERACNELSIACPARQWEGEESGVVAFVISLNQKRRHLSESQRAMIAATLANMPHGGDRKSNQAANLPLVSQSEAAEMLNVSERLLRDAKVIKNESPKLAAEVKTGEKTVTQALRELTHSQRPKVDPPSGSYRVFLADPPWNYGNAGLQQYGHASHHYPTMTIEELCALPIKAIAQDDAVLFLWVTSPLLEECFPVIKAWGFQYKTSFVWDKVKHNFGHYNSVRHEFLLVCTRGSCTPDVSTLIDSVQTIERSEMHSEKPEEFRKIIDTLYPDGARIELFSRVAAAGWDRWGNEAVA